MFERKNNIKISILLICIAIIGYLFFIFMANPRIVANSNYDEVELFTQEELEFFKQFENQTLKFGFSRGSEISFKYALRDLVKEELSIDMEYILYDTYEEVEEALINGEIDALIDLNGHKTNETLYTVSAPIMNAQQVITHQDHPLGGAFNLEGSTIGLIQGSILYKDLEETIGKDNFEIVFYESLEDVLNALENQEIHAFMTRMDSAIRELIHRENLRIEFSFQDKMINVEFATVNPELYQALGIFEDIMHSTRGDQFQEKLVTMNYQGVAADIQAYIQEKYGDIKAKYDSIEVGMHNASFPYSFFDVDGTPRGIYIEMMDLFQLATGIEYAIRNTPNDADFDHLLDEVMENDIQFLLGIAAEKNNNEMVRIFQETQDNIISIQKHGNHTEQRGLSELTFGISTHQELSPLALGVEEVVTFENYDDAFKALLAGEIDIFIGRESVLDYYRDVMGISNLSQTPHINRFSSHGIIGNQDNIQLNAIMTDINRLHTLVYLWQSDVRWENQAIDYQERYTQLKKRQEHLLLLGVGISAALAAIWFLKKEKENKRLKRATERDQLTDLYNKNTYERKCQELIEENSDTLGVFFFIDLDDFKHVNDIYGHEVGDQMIIKFADILKKVVTKNSNTICFRIAGDEFGIFSMGYKERAEIEHIVKVMKERINGEVMGDAKTAVPIKFSAGGSIYNLDTKDFANLKKYADFAMYQAKRKKNGKTHNVELFDMDQLHEYHRENLSQNIIDSVLEARQIEPLYQPVCWLNNDHIYGYEGRSRTNNLNVTNIVQLIEMAESAGKADQLDLLMMEEVIRNFKGDGKLFINILSKSPEAVWEYIEKMTQIAEEEEISLKDIVIELSEKTKWSEESIQTLSDCRAKYKFQLAIDDFGVGFASHAILLDVQPDIVKIDRYFIKNIHEDKRKYSFVKLFIEVTKDQNITVVSKGIEKPQELEVLKELGSHLGQGFYLGKPE